MSPIMPTPNDRPVRSQTIIAQGIRVEGVFRGQGQVTIEGELKGELVVEGSLTIGDKAQVEAQVQADEATLAGTIRGNVKVKGRIEITSTARVKGDLHCAHLAVQDGAVIDGNVHCGSLES